MQTNYQSLVCMRVEVNNGKLINETALEQQTNLKFDCLPEVAFPRLTYTESRRRSQLQVAETLLSDFENSFKDRTSIHMELMKLDNTVRTNGTINTDEISKSERYLENVRFCNKTKSVSNCWY